MKKFLLSFLCFLLAVAGGYAEGSDDFDKLTSNNSYMDFTSPAGWSCTKSQRVSIDGTIAPTINGKKSAKGTITSPTLTGGCGTLSLKYAYTYSEKNGVSFNVAIKQGGVVVQQFDVVNKSATKGSIYTWTQDVNVQGDFVIYITNNSPTNSSSNADRFSIWNIKWTTPGEETLPQLDKPVFSPTEYNFVKSTIVTISEPQESTIYYTLDGTDPTTDSEIYPTSGIELTDTKTIKAIAVKEGYENSEVATATYTRVAAAPTITFEGESTFNITAAEGTTVYYTLNGKTPNNKSDECPETITLKADATLKVIAYEGKYKSDIVEQKFTLVSSGSTDSSAGTATLVTDVADLSAGDQVVIVASDYNFALSMPNSNGNNFLTTQISKTENSSIIELNNAVTNITLEKGEESGTYAFKSEYGYLYAPGTENSTNNHLKVQDNRSYAGSWEISIVEGVATIVSKGETPRNTIRFNNSSNPKLFSCYSSGQQNVSLYKVNTATIENPILNVTSAGWATLYLGYNVVIPEGVTCYVASQINGESVKLEEVTDVLPANTAVIVKAAEGEYTFEVTKETATVESKMKGTTKNEYITEEAYVLADGDDGVALYKVVMNGGVFLNNANKAYLPASALPQTLNAKALKFNFDTTGMEGVKVETEGKKVIYDLSGRRMNEMTQPGVYIVNGKKMMVK